MPDRVFFACGSCHILAHAFLERYGTPEHEVTWIKPAAGYWGNHIFVSAADWVFDFHGYSRRPALVSEAKSRAFGLWLAEPGQFLHDPLPRARRYLDRFPAPDRIVMYGRA